jgi:hypothetical protein
VKRKLYPVVARRYMSQKPNWSYCYGQLIFGYKCTFVIAAFVTWCMRWLHIDELSHNRQRLRYRLASSFHLRTCSLVYCFIIEIRLTSPLAHRGVTRIALMKTYGAQEYTPLSISLQARKRTSSSMKCSIRRRIALILDTWSLM